LGSVELGQHLLLLNSNKNIRFYKYQSRLFAGIFAIFVSEKQKKINMDFYNILLNAHKGFGYLEILLVTLFVIALLATMFGFSGKVNNFLKKTTLFTMIFFHVQFLLGLVMLIINFSNGLNMGEVMKNSALRFQYVEHPFSMLIAAVLMTIVNKKVKTNPTISLGVVIMGLIAVGLFAFAFPWARVFGA
jgi:hypothetical protein